MYVSYMLRYMRKYRVAVWKFRSVYISWVKCVEFRICSLYENSTQPIYAKWNFPPLSIETVHFCFKGGQVVFFIFIQILIENYASKQWRPCSDTVLDSCI